MEFECIYLQLDVNKMVLCGGYYLKKKKMFTGAIDHAPWIILRVFTGTGTIVPVSWQALNKDIT
jgi:hypothetical protein